MIDLTKLNKNQLAAVSAPTGSTLVVAGAGTGKTRVLTLRFAYLVTTLNYDQTKILAITFTNRAAEEMKLRITDVLNKVYLPWICTYHAACLKILREDINYLNRNNNFTIIDEEDQLAIMKDIYRVNNINQELIKPKKMINSIAAIKMTQVDLALITSFSQLKKLNIYNFDELKQVKYVNKLYQTKLLESNCLDFEDLLILTKKLLSDFPHICNKWQNYFKYILVDEFQDTNKTQFEILNMLINPAHNNVFVVGDPDQSIYTWRGAYPQIFKNFLDRFKNTQTYILDTNYRSTKAILSVANDLIQVNQNRIHKDLITDNNQGDKPIFYLANTRQEEAEYVCNKITQLVNNKQCQHKDIGVLYRSNYLSRFIEQELVNQSIPYRIYGGVKFFQRLEIKDLLAYLKLIVDPCNEIALRRIINVPKRGIGRTTTDRIDAYATKNKVSFAYALNLSEQDLDLPWSINPIRKFLYTLKTLREKQTTLSISETVEAIIQSIEYDKYLQSLDFEDRISNIEELIGAIKEYELQNPQAKIVDYLQEISLYTDNEKNVKAKNDSVTLLTVHTAKGTEYHAVFVVGLNEGVFPSSKAEDLDEERRIGYVAITRAKHYLFLTCSQQDMTQQGNVYQATSRFINEINKSYLEYHQPDVVNDKHQYKYIDNTPTYVVGNVVKHAIFGVGIVVGVRGHLINVSFKAPYGIKTLVKNHHALRQIKN